MTLVSNYVGNVRECCVVTVFGDSGVSRGLRPGLYRGWTIKI